jgi:hypothetical protein
MRDRLYLKRIPGTDAHEVVALVTAEAVEAARQTREDAPRAHARREADRIATAAHRARSRAIWDAAEAWRLDNLRRASDSLRRMDGLLAKLGEGIGKGGKAGW